MYYLHYSIFIVFKKHKNYILLLKSYYIFVQRDKIHFELIFILNFLN